MNTTTNTTIVGKLFHYALILEDKGCMDRYQGFHKKKDAIEAFNYRKNRPCCGFTETKLYQGSCIVTSYSIQFLGKEYLIAYDEAFEEESG